MKDSLNESLYLNSDYIIKVFNAKKNVIFLEKKRYRLKKEYRRLERNRRFSKKKDKKYRFN